VRKKLAAISTSGVGRRLTLEWPCSPVLYILYIHEEGKGRHEEDVVEIE
jgi:hypothetical protein